MRELYGAYVGDTFLYFYSNTMIHVSSYRAIYLNVRSLNTKYIPVQPTNSIKREIY